MKTVAIYYKTTADSYKSLWCSSFEEGVNKHSDEWQAIPVKDGSVIESDYAFVFNYQMFNDANKSNTTLRRRVIDKFEPTGKIFYSDGDVLISYCDFNNGQDKEETISGLRYVRIPYGHVHPLKGCKWFMDPNADIGRWNKIKLDRNIVVKDYDLKNGDYILINLNRGSEGYSGEQKNAADFAIETTNILRQYTDRPIMIRLHRATGSYGIKDFDKLYAWSTSGVVKDVRIQSKQLVKRHTQDDGYPPILEAIRNSYAVITFASSSASPAIIEGKPVFVTSPNCYFYDMSAGQLSDIEKPNINLNREKWFIKYANTHFNTLDLSSGYFWDIAKRMI
jgi:hypothetical protein